MKLNRLIKISIPTLFFCAATLYPQQENNGGDRSFTFSADRVEATIGDQNSVTVLSGNARVVSDNTEITADYIEVSGQDYRYINCRDGVEVYDSERGIKIRGSSFFYDRDLELSRIEGYNEMEDLKNEMIIRCNFLEDRADNDSVIMEVDVRIFQIDSEDRTLICRSEFALYDRTNEKLTLSGLPVVELDNDVYRAARIFIDLDSKDIDLQGDVSGLITSEESQSTADNSSVAPAAP